MPRKNGPGAVVRAEGRGKRPVEERAPNTTPPAKSPVRRKPSTRAIRTGIALLDPRGGQ